MSSPPVLTVSELTAQLRQLVEGSFPLVWVTGEISNCKRHASGHIYLTLKDSKSQLKGVLWRSTAQRLRFQLHDGLEVLARGRLTLYEPRGEYQMILDEVQPKGMGPLELAFRQLKDKLLRMGWFADERKKPLPRYPRRIGLVTSRSGAAIRDLLQILPRRWPAAQIWVCPVPVQGDGAAAAIARAIQTLNQLELVDVMIVGRGGGSLEDLWAFNEEAVAEAIFHSRIPIISAVGHQIDFTIADFVADRRAATPSEAAELAVPDRQELTQGLAELGSRLRGRLLDRLGYAQERLARFRESRLFRDPVQGIREHQQRLDDLEDRLSRSLRTYLDRSRGRAATEAARLEGLSPLNVLTRGYSLTLKAGDQALIRDAASVLVGERIHTRLSHGRLMSRVEEVDSDA